MLPFTPRLRMAIASAEAFASSQQRRDISDLDLLAGLLSLGDGVAVNVLKAAGFTDADAAPVTKEPHIPVGTCESYTLDALGSLSNAFAEAIRIGHRLVGVEHMLVGILMQESAELSALFHKKNIRVDDLLRAVRAEV